MIFCAHTQEGMRSIAGGGGGGGEGGNVRQGETRIPGEAMYPEAIIGFITRENASLDPLACLIKPLLRP